ncbi:Putative amino-acid ABC transporter-binding protein YhdW [Seminavis robusta]|uniref:Amino-acid ABC transporter-binding protein YhdW n=1 Tax=Seminavis robusta TaxID=568900 RepID=A0A9N8HRE2_9STRA|nr:Putative amino-acid ABC transporter-binding protein YhdW [Seminavis robusta]|eukprot:Sro1067_g237390.1 Putative amino-acid ABC transporter-binding protein YhdW (872) ;mRNA; f:15364-18059
MGRATVESKGTKDGSSKERPVEAGLSENPQARADWEAKRGSSSPSSKKTGNATVPGAVSSTGGRPSNSKRGLRRANTGSDDGQQEGREGHASTDFSAASNRSIASKHGLRRRNDVALTSNKGQEEDRPYSTVSTTETSHNKSSAGTLMSKTEFVAMPENAADVVDDPTAMMDPEGAPDHRPSKSEILFDNKSSAGTLMSTTEFVDMPENEANAGDNPTTMDLESARFHRPSKSEFLIEATLVPDDPVTPQQEPSPELAKVVEAEQLYFGFSKRQLLFLGGCLVLIAVVVVIVAVTLGSGGGDGEEQFSSTSPTNSTPSPTATPLPTLERIQERGEVICGIWDEAKILAVMGGVFQEQEDQIDIALCRALAAAVLGNGSAYRVVEVTQDINFEALANRSIDVLVSHVETSMQADIYETEKGKIEEGFTFSVPFGYIGIFWGGLEHYVQCTEDNYNTRGNCSDLRICMNQDSEWTDIVAESIPESYIAKEDNVTEILNGFKRGDCNVFAVEGTGLTEFLLGLFGYRGEYYRGTKPFFKEPATMATLDGDPEWSDFVNIILMGLFAAEQNNITRSNAAEMLGADVLGEELERAVKEVSNFGDVFELGWVPIVKTREGMNFLNNGSTGLLFTLPLGFIQNEGPGPVAGGTLGEIRDRPDGKLRCGVRLNRPGFAVHNSEKGLPFTGFDIDMCAALAAGLSQGTADAVLFIDVENEAQGYQMLDSGEVDVLAGFTWNIQNDYHEPGTGVGYSFTSPYFYKPVHVDIRNSNATFDDNLCLVTRQDDPQFSSFVFWTVASTWYAEERGVTDANSRDMPDVNLFGFDYSRMFQDSVFAVGNYDQIYERNLASILPRGGRNMLNSAREAGPQLYVPPGYF